MPKTTEKSLIISPQENYLPTIISTIGRRAEKRFLEFFTANIRNKNTRSAYHRAVTKFFTWCEERNLDLNQIEPIHVAAYIEQLTKQLSSPTVKQHLAGIRMLFDWLVVGHIVETNPAQSVRGPKYVVKKGKTPILSPEEARELIESIRTDTVVGLRDRALIGLLIYSFARVSAALSMNVGDYFPQGKRWWLRLHEKGGKQHEIPVHHILEGYLDAYIKKAGIVDDKKSPLFRTAIRKTNQLTNNPLCRENAYHMIKRRAKDAGIQTALGCHTFRATGITVYLQNGGTLEKAQMMAAHESARTTKLYDRTNDQISLDEVERIVF